MSAKWPPGHLDELHPGVPARRGPGSARPGRRRRRCRARSRPGAGPLVEQHHRVGRAGSTSPSSACVASSPRSQPDRLAQVAHRRQGTTAHRAPGRGQPEREVAAGRVAGHDGIGRWRRPRPPSRSGQRVEARAYVVAGDRPATAAADPAVLRRRHDPARARRAPGPSAGCGGGPTPASRSRRAAGRRSAPGRAGRQVQVDHGVVVVGVPDGRVGEVGRLMSATLRAALG